MIVYESLETKETPSWVIPKVVAVAYWSCRLRGLFITKLKVTVQTGFHKGGRNESLSLTRVIAKRASTVLAINNYYC